MLEKILKLDLLKAVMVLPIFQLPAQRNTRTNRVSKKKLRSGSMLYFLESLLRLQESTLEKDQQFMLKASSKLKSMQTKMELKSILLK